MLICSGYFTKGDRQILNAVAEPNTQNSFAVKVAIEGYIEEYQPKYLRLMLGDELAERVEAYLEAQDTPTTPTDEEETPVVGEEDVLAGKICDHLRESFAEYVFFYILRSNHEQATINGVVRLQSANTLVSPLRAMVSAWDRMIEWNEKFVEWAKNENEIKVYIHEEMLQPHNMLNI